MAKKVLINILYIVIAIGLVLGVWAVGSAVIDSSLVLPSITETAGAFGIVFKSEMFWAGLRGTMLRCTIGYFISLALFFVTFYFSTAYTPFRRLIEPIISMLRSLPAVAVTLMLMIAVGGSGAPVVLGVLVIYPIMYSAARARTATVPIELKEVCRLCGASKFQTFKSLWFPCLAGGLPESLSSAFSYNIKTVVGAEILAQTARSLGMLMKLSQMYIDPAQLIAYVIVTVLLSVVFEIIIRVLLKIALSKYSD